MHSNLVKIKIPLQIHQLFILTAQPVLLAVAQTFYTQTTCTWCTLPSVSSEIFLWWKSVLVMRWHTTVVESLSFRRLKSFICGFCWSCSSSGWAEWVDVQSAGTPGIWGIWAIRVQALRSSKGSSVRCFSVGQKQAQYHKKRFAEALHLFVSSLF